MVLAYAKIFVSISRIVFSCIFEFMRYESYENKFSADENKENKIEPNINSHEFGHFISYTVCRHE